MKPLNILVIGTGMYACGRGTEGYGTVLPAVFEWKRKNGRGDIYIAGRDAVSVKAAKNKLEGLRKDMGLDISATYFSRKVRSCSEGYEDAIRTIEKPACAIVVVPDAIHRAVAGATIEAGLHTLVVKPLAPTLKEVNELIALADKRKVYGAVEFHKRFDYANLKLKDVINQGLLGDPLYFVVQYSQRKSVPSKQFRKWVETTNVFQYLGVHYVDIIYFVTGARPIRAMALAQKGWLRSKGIDVYDSIEGIIEWEMANKRKFISYIITNWIDPESTSAMSDQKIKVIGTKGRFESDQKQRGITIVTDNRGIEEPNPYFCSPYGSKRNISYKGYGIDSIHQFLNDVVSIENSDCKVEDLERTRPTFRQSVVPTKVLEAVNRSLKKNGEWVYIENK